jgi:transposase
MMRYYVFMYIESIPNRSSPPAILLRESVREGATVRKHTLANLSAWPPRKIEALRRVLRGEGGEDGCAAPAQALVITRTRPHGHVAAVLGMIRKAGLEALVASRRCRQRDLVLALIAARILFPASKLDTIPRWSSCTLAEELGVGDADEDELYDALDWLLARQEALEAKLARRHLSDGASVLYDLSSSYYYGTHCPLVKFGHDRDGKKGLPIIVYGVLANSAGCPVAAEVYAGNTSDPKTVLDQVSKLRARFGTGRVVFIGDRGSVTSTNIEKLKACPDVGWIGALRTEAIRELVATRVIQPSLFDRQNLAEISSPDFPGERLVACFNPLLAEERRRKRDELLAATAKELARLMAEVQRRRHTPLTEAQIALKAGKRVNKYKMAKHYELTIAPGAFTYARKTAQIQAEAQLDGIYVVRTSEPAETWPAAQVVRGYKSLAHVERAFRCLKGVDLKVRPIWLRTEAHVKAHVLLCVLAYYVEWHLRAAWAELLYADEELAARRATRDPVLPPETSPAAVTKKATHVTTTGLPVQSFASLLTDLATLARNTCTMRDDAEGTSFVRHTEPTPLQRRAMQLLDLYPVART